MSSVLKISAAIFFFNFSIATFASNTTVMVFGVFDLLHHGHLSFLEQAKRNGDTLIIALARDALVQKAKKRLPIQNEHVRKLVLDSLPIVDQVILGDEEFGTYSVIKEYKPDLICLGYDQQSFAQDLQRAIAAKQIPYLELVYLDSYQPEIFHTSLIRAEFGI